MSSSANEGSTRLAAAAAAAGIGAFALPLLAPWHLLTVLLAAASAVATRESRGYRAAMGALSLATLFLVLLGSISSPLAAAALSIAALGAVGHPHLALAVALLHTSAAASATELLGASLNSIGLVASAPAAITALALAAAAPSTRAARWAVAAGIGSLLMAWIGNRIAPTPGVALVLSAMPVITLAAVLPTMQQRKRHPIQLVSVAALLMASLATWLWMQPRAAGEVWLLLPNAPDAYEAKYFENYTEALGFGGVKARVASRPEQIPRNAVVLMPWMTAAFPEDFRIGALARERHWTLLVGGEHTNLGGVAERIEVESGRALLRRDLTVPPDNSDDSGPLHVSGIHSWPHESIFNRGASVNISSLLDKVLLAGDGWWAEPDIGEWLWVGDYVWQRRDRAGRLALAAAFDLGGARWVVVGDNSPLINQQVYADPRALTHLLSASTLWPALLKDLLLTAIAVTAICGVHASLVVSIAVLAAVAANIADRPSLPWQEFYVGESGFDDSNFNQALAHTPHLRDGRHLMRMRLPISGNVRLPPGASTVFMLVDGTAAIGGVRLEGCRRLGSLQTSEGPHIMDGQACRVVGAARVLLGTSDAAAALVVRHDSAEAIVILDRAFLSKGAPEANAKWLTGMMRE